jgi:hypothetical protein
MMPEQPQQGQDDETHLFNPYLLNGPICRVPKVRFMMDDVEHFVNDPKIKKCPACLSAWAKHDKCKGIRRIAAGRGTE